MKEMKRGEGGRGERERERRLLKFHETFIGGGTYSGHYGTIKVVLVP